MLRLAIVSLALFASVAAAGCASSSGEDDGTIPGDGESAEAEGALTDSDEPPARVNVDSYAKTFEDRILTRALDKTDRHPALPVGARLAIIRTMKYAGEASVLGFDSSTLATVIMTKADLDASSRPAASEDGANAYSDHLAALGRNDKTLTHLDGDDPGHEEATLTIDMCQSSKSWEQGMWDWLVGLSNQLHAPIPVGVAMTGGWAKAHASQLTQLRKWHDDGKLAITWINHSYTHPLKCNADKSKCAFLTASDVDFTHEVLDNERLLLRQGLAVSPLFRFPGLIHNAQRRKELNALSLFPLDADAWLALGKPNHDNAVILVHGNGNEPLGIRLLNQGMAKEPWKSGLASHATQLVSPLGAIFRSKGGETPDPEPAGAQSQ